MTPTTQIQEPRIADDSHARAILSNQLYQNLKLSQSTLKRLDEKPPKGRVKRYQELIRVIRKAVGPGMMREEFLQLSLPSKRHSYNLWSLDRNLYPIDQRKDYEERKLIPCSLTKIDPKRLQITEISEVCFVTEHVLERVIRRNQSRNMGEILDHIRRYILFLMEYELENSLENKHNFVIVGPDGFIPCKRDRDSGRALMLTWIPRQWWTPRQEAKLTLLSDKCKKNNELIIVDTSKFNESCFLDPTTH